MRVKLVFDHWEKWNKETNEIEDLTGTEEGCEIFYV